MDVDDEGPSGRQEDAAHFTAGDLVYVLRPLLPRRLLGLLARAHATLSRWLDAELRNTVRENLAEFEGLDAAHPEIRRMTRRFFDYRSLRRLLTTLAPGMSDAELADLVRIDGLEHLEAARNDGPGAVLLGSHLHSLLMFVCIVRLNREGHGVLVAMPTSRDPWRGSRFRRLWDRWTDTPTLREELGARHVQFNVRPLVRALGERRVVATTGDGWHSAGFVDVDFAGRTMPLTTGAFSLARSTGVPVVPLFTVGDPFEELRFRLEPAFTVDTSGDRKSDLRRAAQRYADRLEHHLREDPAAWDHWSVEHALDAMSEVPERSLEERYTV